MMNGIGLRTNLQSYLVQFRSSPRIKFVSIRYVSVVIISLEFLILARFLGPQAYGNYALIGQMALFFVLTGAGSASGYVYIYYKDSHPDLDESYVAGAIQQYLFGTLIAVALLVIIKPSLAIAGILFLIYIPYYITEPMLRVRNVFSLPAVARAFGSILTLMIATVLWASRDPNGLFLNAAVLALLAGNTIGFSVYYVYLVKSGYLRIDMHGFGSKLFRLHDWKMYFQTVLKSGLPLAIASILFMLFSYIDRLFIEAYRSPTSLSTYTLSLQLAQGSLILLTSLNLISNVRIGEKVSGESKHLAEAVKRQFRITTLAGIFVYLSLAGGTFFLSITVFKDYDDLLLITMILGSGYLFFYMVGSISGVLFFGNKIAYLAIGYLFAMMVSVSGNFLAVRLDWWFGVPVIISALSLMVLSLWIYLYVHKLIAVDEIKVQR